jgi:HD-GYP domain-containing protein (c-di-GMP phosphodiesterase class II)
MGSRKIKEIGDEAFKSYDMDRLIIGKPLPFDIFAKDKGVIKPLFNKGTILTNISKELLKEKGISKVYIEANNSYSFDLYLSKRKLEEESLHDYKVFRDYSFYKDNHYQIDRTFLIAGRDISFSLFHLNKLNFAPILEATEKSPANINEKMLNVEGDILIKKSDIPLYKSYLESLLTEESIPEDDKQKIRAAAVKEALKIVVKDILDEPMSKENIKKSKSLIANMVESILVNKDVVYDLLSLRNYDLYTYIHSMNVAVLSVGLGAAIGLEKEHLKNLGVVALLHDIGKSAISLEILNKQDSLSDQEYEIFKTHVIEGERILKSHSDIPEESLHAVLQHHEKISGKGYPFNLSGNDIKLFGRIAAIADSYDILTTTRPFRYAMTPFYALLHIGKEKGDYDPELLKIFIKMLGKIT